MSTFITFSISPSSMNPFRLCGDVAQFAAKVVLLRILILDPYCIGLSLKTQILYFCVYVTRYLDLLSIFQSWYNSLFKAYFTVTTCIAVATIYAKHKNYDAGEAKRLDRFPAWLLCCILLATTSAPVVVVMGWMGMPWSVPAVVEILWHLSLGLEAFALLPQYFVMHRMRDQIDKWTAAYVFLQGSYRMLYMCSWLVKYMTSTYYYQPYLWLSGCIQSALFLLYWSTWSTHRYLHQTTNQGAQETLLEDPHQLAGLDGGGYEPPSRRLKRCGTA